jgi:hypothetical protein
MSQAPSKVLKEIELNNKKVFDSFLDVEKPIIAAVNGPAIGASVTTASLCNAVSSFHVVVHCMLILIRSFYAFRSSLRIRPHF